MREEPDNLAANLNDGNLASCVYHSNTSVNNTLFKIKKAKKDHLLLVLLYGQVSCLITDGISVFAGSQQCIDDSETCSSHELVLCSYVRQVALDEDSFNVCEYVCECNYQSCDIIVVELLPSNVYGNTDWKLCEIRF